MNTKKERTFFADNLKTLRHFKKLSTSEFARLIGVEPKRLTEVENGRLLPNEIEIQAVLKEFSMTREQILLSRFEISMSEFSSSSLKDLDIKILLKYGIEFDRIGYTLNLVEENSLRQAMQEYASQRNQDLDKDREIMRLNGIIGKLQTSTNKLNEELKANYDIAQNLFTKRGIKIAIKLFSKWSLS